jgi:hypothetical protein
VEGRVWKVERRFEIASEHCETENLFSMNSEQWCDLVRHSLCECVDCF